MEPCDGTNEMFIFMVQYTDLTQPSKKIHASTPSRRRLEGYIDRSDFSPAGVGFRRRVGPEDQDSINTCIDP